MKNKKVLLILITVLSTLTIFMLARMIFKKQEAERVGFISQNNFSTFVPAHAPTMGAKEPKVYVVEFFDPECESCREFYPHTKMMLEEFEGQMQLVLRYAPFHGNSVMVIKILEAARKQNKYFEVLELLFRTQPEWGSHHHPNPELIWKYLPDSGVDVDKIRADMNDPEIEKIIAQDMADLRTLGVQGTPTFFVNGKPLDRFGPEALREAIQNALNN